jgi:DNA-binding GntR family transcriptional regulator
MINTTLPWLMSPSPKAAANSSEAASNRLSDIRDTSLSKLVRDDIQALILKGFFLPGQHINEPDVASRLEVSRVPVREALRELESAGLVVSRKHSGVFVRQMTAAEIHDLYQLRGLLDGFAGRCAAQLPSQNHRLLLTVLDASVQTMKQAIAQGVVQHYYLENLHFHWAIVSSAGNQQLSNTYRDIVQKLHLSRLKNLSQDTGMKASIAEHMSIVQSIRDADAERCESLMSDHVGDAYQRMQKSIVPKNPHTL